ncbi:protein of unknown function [Pseudorhizobium banfieldiae]|uniref:Uncharacterized protein n=1 Tax=Pseudorhizobium banfieldiae TaxID=1125847 RepID=L0NDA6_9HYPH|nr:hypothetical protein [Pseudorhizobium banfieldiae]CAD6605945.1 hypothetical protein RNT25_01752 [arsenite-oxidising bacterium NT-25]CCF19098.1 protein of unknown function [Pseudorhizobium banfieldiae]
MKTQEQIDRSKIVVLTEETADAIRSWHRGESLTERQANLIHQAGQQTLARALGAQL